MKNPIQLVWLQCVRSTCEVKMKRFCVGSAMSVALALGLCSCDSEKALTPTSSVVHGSIVDQNGKPIPGAVVAARRAQVQTVTDENGEYALPKAESLDGSDTLDMTDNKWFRVAMPITWKVKRFEDAVVVKRKVTGSVAGDLGGLLKARIHWRTKGTVEGIPQVVDLVKGGYQGEIATLFSKDSLEVQVFLLDTALRIVGRSRFLQINPRSGNIVVPAFPKLNTFEPLSPVYGCGQMGSWDTCTVLLTQPEDSATKMWYREGGEAWAEFRGAFLIPPKLRRIESLTAEHRSTVIEILRRDSAGVERLDTVRIPWKLNSPEPILRYRSSVLNVNLDSYDCQEEQEFDIDLDYKVHSDLAKVQAEIVYGTYQDYETSYGACGKSACGVRKEWKYIEKAVIPDVIIGKQKIRISKGVNGKVYMVLKVVVDGREKYYSDTVLLSVAPLTLENPVTFVGWDSAGFVLRFEKPIYGQKLVWLQHVERPPPGILTRSMSRFEPNAIGHLGDDNRTVFFYRKDFDSLVFTFNKGFDSLTEGGWGAVSVPQWPSKIILEGSNALEVWHYPVVRYPESPAGKRFREKYRNRMDSVIINLGQDSNHLVQYKETAKGFDIRADDWSGFYDKHAFGAVFWQDTLPSGCPRKIRFRASGTDSTLLRMYTNIGVDYPNRESGDWKELGYIGKEVLIGDSARWYYPLDDDGEWKNVAFFRYDWPIDRKLFWQSGIMGSYDQTMLVGLCGNADSNNCPEKRWLTVTDIEVYSDCTEPIPGVVP